jgi:H+/Cl- antiporter ClcA
LKRDGLLVGAGYARAFVKWLIAGAAIGLVCGAVGALFAHGVNWATGMRIGHDWLIWLLPVGGLFIAGAYRLAGLPLSTGTDRIFTSVRTQEKVPVVMAPLIFISTVATHLLGGSAGREGAALQLGGSLAAWLGDSVPHRRDDRRIFEICGMAAVFSALFGTPFTAAFFVMEVVDVGAFYHRALFPCVVSSVTAGLLAAKMGVHAEVFPLAQSMASICAPELLRAAALAALCAVAAIIFCAVMHVTPKLLKKILPNDFARIFAGGAVIALITMLSGSRAYNGGGMDIIASALNAGEAKPWAFAAKIGLTALTLGSGFKGGEIVPSFFVGATFGCVMGGLLGLNPALGAAIGLVAVFCGVTNTPVASLILSVEMFGAEYLPLFGVAVAVSFMLSGHVSLYHTQNFVGRKLGFEYSEKQG